MPLYRPENPYDMSQKAMGQASNTMASQTKEGPRTEVEAAPPSAGQFAMTGLSLYGAGDQVWKYGSKGYEFLKSKWGTPDTAAQAAQAGSGAAPAGGAVQAQQAADLAAPSVQLQTGAPAAATAARLSR